ncbi:TIGR01244 family sulfur transferase [Mesorhizobium sp. WSM2239]|uniref:TIGR01244 family sulfur transferase n=2 Tax=unclassified Mesorhizobium TaxID=325217 RepID=A0AAU8D0Y7_9HYPH
MEYRQISDGYAVSGQIAAEDIAAIKAAGFKSVISNRPDNEQPGQPSTAEIRQAAEAAGLSFRHVPIVSGMPMTGDDVAAMANALDELEGPVFAYCRSGARSTNLFMAVQQTKG